MPTRNRPIIIAVLLAGAIGFVSLYFVLVTSPGTTRSGEEIFRTFCNSCHTSRTIKAPNIGDRNAWKPRIAKGSDVLLEHVINGYRGMPPRGTCGNCSVMELQNTINYILSKSR